MKARTALLASLLVLTTPVTAGAQATARGADPEGLPATVTLPPELDAVLRAYEMAWSARDASALADLFTPDGFVMRPGRPPAVGRDAIEAAYRGLGGPLVLRPWSWGAEGAVGWILGGWAGAHDQPDLGKFVLALRRSPTGTWRIAADIDNGN
jgi:ketosteroid isomerase-like protein